MGSDGRMYYEHFFFSNKLVQSILGLRPDQSQNDQLFSLCLIIFYIFPGLVQQLYQLFTSEVLMKVAVGVLQITMGAIGLLTGYSTTYFNFVTMKLLVSDINNNCNQVSSELDLAVLEEYIKQSKLYVCLLLGVLNGYAISIIAPCVVKVCLYFSGILDENQLSLIVPVNNINKAGVKYFNLLIYQIIAVVLVVTVGAVSFSGYLIAVLFACYQFRVLILKIRHPFEKHSKYIGNDCYFRTSQEEWDWIIDVINRYKKVAEYVDLLNNFSKKVYLSVVVLATTLIIFDFLYVFQLSVNLKNAAEIVECSFYITGSTLTLYINLYLGQELLNYSNTVFKELCQVPFYILSNKSQKTLLFMITRSCKQSILSIGGMFMSSHETFAALMRKAFSFAMVYYSYV